MRYETLKLEERGETLIVRLNRPEKLNAFDTNLIGELISLCRELKTDLSTRFVVFTGEGRAFSSGADLGGMQSGGGSGRIAPEDAARLGQFSGQELMRSVEQLEQVTLAAVNGVCLGAGVALILACDFRFATESADFGLPETNIGYFFTWGSSPRLTRIVGPSRAKEWIMTCDRIDAERAREWGLVDHVVPDDQLLKQCEALIARIAANGPVSVRLTKKLVNAYALQGMADLFVCEPELATQITLTGEPEQMVRAYLERRGKAR
ncbi:MAG: enoyl-CoA hydratase/isomerase family protein [Deltaproteobacteria bacterium]|nr:enoyl-CoA hydratase/isomerase family protein [Deltaproteobacteria bacterium]